MVENFIVYVVMEVLGPWPTLFIISGLLALLVNPLGVGGLGGCTKRLVTA